MKNQIAGWNFLLGFLLAGSAVAADEVILANGQHANADLVRRVSQDTSSLPASATEAASAATATTNVIPMDNSRSKSRDPLTRPTATLSPSDGERRRSAVSTNAMPPLPAGVTELKFNEFFRQPIGSRGLEFTEKLRALEGRRIRILGYMARQTKPEDHCFLLAPVPLTLNEVEYGHADDLPATTLHVFTTKDAPARTLYTPGPLLLTGTLQLGNRLEADGRTSTVRLQLDPPTAEQKEAAHAGARKVPANDPHAGHAH